MKTKRRSIITDFFLTCIFVVMICLIPWAYSYIGVSIIAFLEEIGLPPSLTLFLFLCFIFFIVLVSVLGRSGVTFLLRLIALNQVTPRKPEAISVKEPDSEEGNPSFGIVTLSGFCIYFGFGVLFAKIIRSYIELGTLSVKMLMGALTIIAMFFILAYAITYKHYRRTKTPYETCRLIFLIHILPFAIGFMVVASGLLLLR